MPLYENTEGTSRRFWEITLSGKSLTTRWGKTGSQGQEKKQRFASAGEARREHDKRIAEKMKKGYALADGQQVPAEDSDGKGSSGVARRNPKLEAAIAKDPNNIEGYLVYGDWLQERRDPRGELIALQCAAHEVRGKEATKLKKRASALVLEHQQFLLGPLAGNEDTDVKLEWRFGFIRGAHLARSSYKSNLNVVDAVGALRKLPSARFLRELSLADFTEKDHGAAVKALAETPYPYLERLQIGDGEYPEQGLYSTELGDVSVLYKALPGLRALRLRAISLNLGAVNLPELREFTLETGCIPHKAVRSIVKAKWPKLERLEVWFGVIKYGVGDGGALDIQPLLDGKGLANLKHLGLRNTMFTSKVCEALPNAKILPQLESLDLSMGTMRDEHAAVLVEHAAAFKHLKHLDVSENMLSEEGMEMLQGLCESVTAGHQREDEAEDEDERYNAFFE